MEQSKQNLIKILLIVNLLISTCTAIGVGYLAFKQNTNPEFSEMRPGGDGQMFPGEEQFKPNEDQSNQ